MESQRIATLVAGVVRYDAAALLEAELRTRAEQLQATPLLFVRGTTTFEAGGDAILATHIENIRALDMLAQASGTRFTIEITGHADSEVRPRPTTPSVHSEPTVCVRRFATGRAEP